MCEVSEFAQQHQAWALRPDACLAARVWLPRRQWPIRLATMPSYRCAAESVPSARSSWYCRPLVARCNSVSSVARRSRSIVALDVRVMVLLPARRCWRAAPCNRRPVGGPRGRCRRRRWPRPHRVRRAGLGDMLRRSRKAAGNGLVSGAGMIAPGRPSMRPGSGPGLPGRELIVPGNAQPCAALWRGSR